MRRESVTLPVDLQRVKNWLFLIIPAKSFCAGYRDTKEGGGEDEAQLYIRFPVLEGRGNLL